MRVNQTEASRGRAQVASAGRFGEALRRAREGDETARRAGSGRGAPPRTEGRRPISARSREGETARRAAGPEEARGAAAGDPARPGAPADVAAAPEIAALVRALPVAVVAALAREGTPLALSFGRSLDVELRSVPGGVEILLRPGPRLLHAAQAELPRVVAALRVRGVVVARAEVRSRGGGASRAR